jgi:hypothetical protein
MTSRYARPAIRTNVLTTGPTVFLQGLSSLGLLMLLSGAPIRHHEALETEIELDRLASASCQS